MTRYFQLITARPLPVLIIAAVLGLGFGSQILRLGRETSPDAFIPPDHPALVQKQRVKELFGLKELIAVAVVRDAPGGVLVPATLQLVRDLTAAIQELTDSPEQVISITTESGVFSDEGLPGFELLIPEIPASAEEAAAIGEEILGYELYRGILLSEDASATCIVLRLDDDVQADRIYRQLRALLDHFPTPSGERLLVAGEAAVRAHMGQAVSDDALRMNFVCPVVMMLLIILAYRSGRGTILPIAVIGGSAALALGTMALAGKPVYIITNGIFVIIMALGVADSLHLLGQYYEEQLADSSRSRQQLVVAACMALWYPLLITSLTDMAGFFALYLGGVMPPIRYFGLFTTVGVAGALLYSYTVVPAGLAILPLRGSRAFLSGHKREQGDSSWQAGTDRLGKALGRLGRLVYQKRRAVVVGGCLLIVVAILAATRLIVNDARVLAFKDHHPIVQANRELNRRFDGTNELNIVITADREGAFLEPEVLHSIEQLEAFAESLPHVGGTHSLPGWVKRAHQKMNNEDPAFYAIPDDPMETRFYLDTLLYENSPMAEFLREAVDHTYSRTNVIVRMRSSEYIHEREVIKAVEQYLADGGLGDPGLHAELSGRVNLDYHWLRMVRTSHIKSVVLTAGCVLLLTGLMFRSVVAGLLCALTTGMAVVVNYAIMGLAGIPLGVGTSMFASIAIGAGVNFPIHMLDRLRLGLQRGEKEPGQVFANAAAFTGRALFFTAFVVAVGFMLLMVSEFRTLIRFGFLIGFSTIVSFVTSITLLPAVVAVLRPRAIWGAPTEAAPEDAP